MGVSAVVGLVFSTVAEPVLRALKRGAWGLAGVCLLRGIAVAGAALNGPSCLRATSDRARRPVSPLAIPREGADALS